MNGKKKIVLLFLISFCQIILFCFFKPILTYAQSKSLGENGVYRTDVDLSGLFMGADNFSKVATIEKYNNSYYMTFGHSQAISNLKLKSGNKQTGFTKETKEDWVYYTYTLAFERLQGNLDFSCHINSMNRDVEFTIKLELGQVQKIDDYSYEGERPAEYVPVISTTASDIEMEQGSSYVLPSVRATLGDEECHLTTEVYYGSEKITIENNQLILEKLGTYEVIYRAESSAYKTSMGNNTFSEYRFIILSKVGATKLVKFSDKSGCLPENTTVQANNITLGAIYDLVSEKMKKISDNYSIINVKFFSDAGLEINPSGPITMYMMVDMTYDRNQVEVYHMTDDGELTQIDCYGYGRYIGLETEKTGNFIVCIPGVRSVIPLWGYILIIVLSIVLVASLIFIVIVISRKKLKGRRV